MNYDELWHIAGWTMIHYLWVGTLITAAALACRLVLRGATPNARYATALVALAVLAATPLGIGAWLLSGSNAPPIAGKVTATISAEPAIVELSGRDSIQRTARPPLELNSDRHISAAVPAIADNQLLAVFALESIVPFLPWLWLIGAPVTFLMLAAGVFGTQRLRRASRPLDEGQITQVCARLVEALRIGQRVTIAVCDRIAAPVLVGILRPIILLPPAALTGWSPDEIEMVLLHELAHVRRWDNLVNLLQRLVESLLFFHPGVWLISNWVRREREACCDAIVVARTARPHAYAELLVALAAQIPRSVLFHPAATSAMAAGPLHARIRRILQLENDPMLVSGKSFTVMLAALAAAATFAVLYLPTIGQAEESAAAASQTTENSPSSQGSKEPQANFRAPIAQTQNNLKNLALAILNFEATYNSLPPHAKYDVGGKPLLSWRVMILPFLDQANLYEEFRFDQPWNSEHNRKLLTRMPDVFKNPKLDDPTKTNYLAVVGKECVFNGTHDGVKFRQIRDGTARTIALVEADQAVEWTKPEDWQFDRNAPTSNLGAVWGDRWHAAWADGSVREVFTIEPPDLIGIQFTRAGGETRSLDESQGRATGQAEEPTTEITKLYATDGQKSSSKAELRYSVQFEQGASRFLEGDKIQVHEVRGTAKTFEPGNSYWIKGTYTLRSHDRAQLSAFTTAKEAADATPALFPEKNLTQNSLFHGPVQIHQTTLVNGEGTFELFLPMTVRGWPHVSFYPAESGESFGGTYFGTGDSVLKKWSDVYGPDPRTTAGAAETRDSQFPSLNEQKLADLAWKRLQVELEPLGADDLQRVQTLGYEGGLKVTARGNDVTEIWQDDLLVGLHVWPTKSLKDIADVLNRDDLAELNPLKFYLVRKLLIADPKAPNIAREKDVLISGRIALNLQSATPQTGQNHGPTPANPFGSGEAQQPQATFQSPYSPSQPLPLPALPGETSPPQIPQTGEEFERIQDLRRKELAAQRDAVAEQEKLALRYDGKSFGEWRDAWQSELSTEKRHEAVKALAAFGRAGYGEQATEAILDVAGQYDFHVMDDSTDGQLKETILTELAPFDRKQSFAPYWIPSMSARLKNDADQWSWLAYRLFARLRAHDERSVAILRSLAQNGPVEVQAAVLGALVRASRTDRGQPQLDTDTRSRLSAALTDDRPFMVRSAIAALVFDLGTGPDSSVSQLLYQPELIPLLFHSNASIQREARRVLEYISDAEAPKVVESLVAVLDDESRRTDHIAAIRALSAMDSHAESALPKLEELSQSPKELQRRIAAAFAMDRIEGGTRGRNYLTNTLNSISDEKEQTRFNRLMNEEQQIQQQ